jgi:hypothetical protein
MPYPEIVSTSAPVEGAGWINATASNTGSRWELLLHTSDTTTCCQWFDSFFRPRSFKQGKILNLCIFSLSGYSRCNYVPHAGAALNCWSLRLGILSGTGAGTSLVNTQCPHRKCCCSMGRSCTVAHSRAQVKLLQHSIEESLPDCT